MVLLGDGDEPSDVWRGAPPKRGRGPPQLERCGRVGPGRARSGQVRSRFEIRVRFFQFRFFQFRHEVLDEHALDRRRLVPQRP